MITKREVALKYIELLEKGNIKDLLKLFSNKSIVESPIYGVLNATQFYNELRNDTQKSEIAIKGIFEENNSDKLALYFNYRWTLKNNDLVTFDVVDIMEFNNDNQISKIKIIYDTVKSREIVNILRK